MSDSTLASCYISHLFTLASLHLYVVLVIHVGSSIVMYQRKWSWWDIVARMWKRLWWKTNTTTWWQHTCYSVGRLQRYASAVSVAYFV